MRSGHLINLTLATIAAFIIIIAATACHKLPEGILGQEEMAMLLADVHKGEVVVDIERSSFNNDSLRKLMRQSVLAKHNVTQEQWENSLDYYGHHIDDYMKVYDRTIEILSKELEEAGVAVAAAANVSAGDSVNLWNRTAAYRLTGDVAMRNITFSIDADTTAHPGDSYSLRYKLLNRRDGGLKINSAVYVVYADSSMEYRAQESGMEGWSDLRIITDSTRNVVSVYGYMTFDPAAGEISFLDSVMLLRKRLDKSSYHLRGNQHRMGAPKKVVRQDSEMKEEKSIIPSQIRPIDR